IMPGHGRSPGLLVAPRSLATVALALSVASANAKPNSAGSNGCFAIASSASAISVGFMANHTENSSNKHWHGASRGDKPDSSRAGRKRHRMYVLLGFRDRLRPPRSLGVRAI